MENYLKSDQSSNPLPPPPQFGAPISNSDDLYASPYNTSPYPAYPGADDLYPPPPTSNFQAEGAGIPIIPPPVSSSGLGADFLPPPPTMPTNLPPPPTSIGESSMTQTPSSAPPLYGSSFDTDELGGSGMMPPPQMSAGGAAPPAMNPNYIDATVESLGTIVSNQQPPQSVYQTQYSGVQQAQYEASGMMPPAPTPSYPIPPETGIVTPPYPEMQQSQIPQQAAIPQPQQQPLYSSSFLPRPTPQNTRNVLEAEILTGIDPQNPDVSPLFAKRNQKQRADFSQAQCSTRNIRPTCQCVPNAPTVLNQWVLPFGAICQPLAEHEQEIPVAKYIVRCNECRAYINPFVLFLDNGNRWKCNMCNCVNSTPQGYYQSLDEYGMRTDISKVTELRQSTMDFITPKEYLQKPPSSLSLLFILEMTASTLNSGMFQTACETIASVLENPEFLKKQGGERIRVGLITFNSSVQFYEFQPKKNPKMYVISDISAMMIPTVSQNLLVNLVDNQETVVNFLRNKMGERNSVMNQFVKNFGKETDCCLGSALHAAGTILSKRGGKMLIFMSSLPNIGQNALKNRERPENADAGSLSQAAAESMIYGTNAETKLFQPENENYKNMALQLSKDQISVDLFLAPIAPHLYQDLASLASLSKYTGGEIKRYPNYSNKEFGAVLKGDIVRNMTRETGLEAVFRIRVSAGLRISNYYGSFLIRTHELLALPTIDADKAFGIELVHNGNFVATPNACIQTALLYTSTNGERKIRVHTCTLPLTASLHDMYNLVDIHSTMNLMTKIAVDDIPRKGLAATRIKVQNAIVKSIQKYKQFVSPAAKFQQDKLFLNEKIKLLPYYANALLKSECLILGSDSQVNADERIAAFNKFTISGVKKTINNILPNFFELNELLNETSEIFPETKGIFPPLKNLTKIEIQQSGIYLVEDGKDILILIGQEVVGQRKDIIDDILGLIGKLNSETLVNKLMLENDKNLNFEDISYSNSENELKREEEATPASNENLTEFGEKIEKKEEEKSILEDPYKFQPKTNFGKNIQKLVHFIRRRSYSEFIPVRLVIQDWARHFYVRKLIEDKTVSLSVSYPTYVSQIIQQVIQTSS